jgi:hypothetical protein
LAVGVLLLLAGCRPAPMNYELRRLGSDLILFPPVRTSAPNTSDFRVSIKNARKHPSARTGCDFEGELVSLRWHGNTAEVSLKSETYFAEPANQDPAAARRGLYIDPLVSLEAFRASLVALEAKGCLRSEEDKRLRRALAESFPLPPEVASFFQFGSYDVTGFFDLTPDFRMQVVSPVYLNGATPSPDHLAGYEVANYVFTGAHNDDRIRISLFSANKALLGKSPVEESKLQNGLSFPKSFGYFRLLFRTDESSTNRITRAILLYASDNMKLNEATKARLAGPENFCRTLSVSGVTCFTFPANFGVSPELRVRANGRETFVRVGGMVLDALESLGPGAEAPKTLQVRRFFRGQLIPVRFDASSEDILRFVLMPGDEITW